MYKFSGVLLASDFDQSMVDHSLTPSKEVRDAVSYFKENGGLFTVCTGRSHRILPLDPAMINAPALLANGAMGVLAAGPDWTKGEILFLDSLGDECLPALRDIRDFFPKAAVEMHALGDVTYSFRREGAFYTEVDDPADADRPFVKIIVEGEPAEIVGLQRFLAVYHPNALSFFPTTGGYLEIVRCGVSKATGLRRLADRLQIDMAHAYALGDGYNDVEMLRAVAIGFAPANAGPEAKAAADRLVRPVGEHAVAHVIEILDTLY